MNFKQTVIIVAKRSTRFYKWKNKTRITRSDFRITSLDLKVKNSTSQFMSSNRRVTSLKT